MLMSGWLSVSSVCTFDNAPLCLVVCACVWLSVPSVPSVPSLCMYSWQCPSVPHCVCPLSIGVLCMFRSVWWHLFHLSVVKLTTP